MGRVVVGIEFRVLFILSKFYDFWDVVLIGFIKIYFELYFI